MLMPFLAESTSYAIWPVNGALSPQSHIRQQRMLIMSFVATMGASLRTLFISVASGAR